MVMYMYIMGIEFSSVSTIIFCKYYDNDTNVDIKFSEHGAFLE
jgi:hypothetical protein